MPSDTRTFADYGARRPAPDAAQSPVQVVELERQSFSEHFRTARAEAGLSIEELAIAAKVRREIILNLEDGTYPQIDIYYLTTSVERLCLQLGDEGQALLEHFKEEFEDQEQDGPSETDRRHLLPIRPPFHFGDDTLGDLQRTDVSKLPALITLIIFILLAVLITAALFYQRYNARITAEQADRNNLELPQLIQDRRIPLDTLPVPTS